MSLRIRPFATDDHAALVTLIGAVCQESPWMRTRRFEPTPAWLHALDFPHCPYHLLLVGEVEGRVIGWCRLFPPHIGRWSPEVELGIGLLAPYRGRGIGKKMLQQALHWARERGVRRIRLTTHRENLRAQRLFARFGFIVQGERDGERLEMIWGNRQEEKAWDERSCDSVELVGI